MRTQIEVLEYEIQMKMDLLAKLKAEMKYLQRDQMAVMTEDVSISTIQVQQNSSSRLSILLNTESNEEESNLNDPEAWKVLVVNSYNSHES